MRRKNSDILGLSEDAIGLATITSNKPHTLTIYFDQDVVKRLDCDRIIFNRHQLSVRSTTLDETGHKLSNRATGGGGSIAVAGVTNYEELLGNYEVVCEDEFKLYKLESQVI